MEEKDFPQEEVVYIDRLRGNHKNGKIERKDFPQDPLERSTIYWSNLFSGVLRCLSNKDPALVRGLKMALEREGLDFLNLQVFVKNPSDEILERSERFRQSGIIPKLGRGKGKETASPFGIYAHYSALFSLLEDLPKKSRNPNHKRMLLNDRLEKFIRLHPHCRVISDRKLRALCESPKTPKRLTLELIAELYRKTPESIDKLLDQFSKDSRLFSDRFKDTIDKFLTNYFFESEYTPTPSY